MGKSRSSARTFTRGSDIIYSRLGDRRKKNSMLCSKSLISEIECASSLFSAPDLAQQLPPYAFSRARDQRIASTVDSDSLSPLSLPCPDYAYTHTLSLMLLQSLNINVCSPNTHLTLTHETQKNQKQLSLTHKCTRVQESQFPDSRVHEDYHPAVYSCDSSIAA